MKMGGDRGPLPISTVTSAIAAVAMAVMVISCVGAAEEDVPDGSESSVITDAGEEIEDVKKDDISTEKEDEWSIGNIEPHPDCPRFRLQTRPVDSDENWGRTTALTRKYRRARIELVLEDDKAQITEWVWRASRKGGAPPELFVSSDGMWAEVTPEKSGYFSVNVEGRNSEEDYVCHPFPRASVGIHNAYGADVAVVLSWDPDGHLEPEEIVDFDLHYRNRNGAWRNRYWDVFSRNTSADWQEGGIAQMGHYVLMHGRWESTFHQGPTAEEPVDIAVRAIRGLEPGDERILEARVQVFIGGNQALDIRRVMDDYSGAWHVGTLKWPHLDVADDVYPYIWDVNTSE